MRNLFERSRKTVLIIALLSLLFQQVGFTQMVGGLDIPRGMAGTGVSQGFEKFRPEHFRYVSYNPANNDFTALIDKGDLKTLEGESLARSQNKLKRYFLIGITLPNDSFWVNLRIDSAERIIDDNLAKTDMGKVMLEADVRLKKDTAQLTSPLTPEGREYWSKIYKKAAELFGDEQVNIPTLTRPWIVPDEVIIREGKNSAYIYKATLKVLLEQDYLVNSPGYNFSDKRMAALNEYSSQLIRELIIPKLTKAVNNSKPYASLRQVYYSLILARWFKQNFRSSGKNAIAGSLSNLIDTGNLNGLTSQAVWSKDTYFQQYQESFNKGEYNLKEQMFTVSGAKVRQYLSGGASFLDANFNPAGFHGRAADFPGAISENLIAASPVRDINNEVKAGNQELMQRINEAVNEITKGMNSSDIEGLVKRWNGPLANSLALSAEIIPVKIRDGKLIIENINIQIPVGISTFTISPLVMQWVLNNKVIEKLVDKWTEEKKPINWDFLSAHIDISRGNFGQGIKTRLRSMIESVLPAMEGPIDEEIIRALDGAILAGAGASYFAVWAVLEWEGIF